MAGTAATYYCCAAHPVALASGRTLAPGDVADVDTDDASSLVEAGQLIKLAGAKAKTPKEAS